MVGEEVVVDEGYRMDRGYASDCDCGGVPQVGCNTCYDPCMPRAPMARLCLMFPGNAYVQADYLAWWQSGMRIPALLTSSPNGTAANNTGILGRAGTSVLLGNEELLTDTRSGGRIRFGWWLPNYPMLGLEGEYFGLGGDNVNFLRQSTGNPLLARPFFNVQTGQNDSELVAFPGIASGSFQMDASSNLTGIAARVRRRFACGNCETYSDLCGTCVPTMSRFDATLGWRHLFLKERITLTENLQSQQTTNQTQFNIIDDFQTRNTFNGAELGVQWQGRKGLWTLDTLLRLSIGNVNQQVRIGGNTRITPQGEAAQNFGTGFLTQRGNIGLFERDKFAVLPEFGAQLGYQLTPRTRLIAGYTLLFLSSVVRPGDQISLDLHPNLLAPSENLNNQVARPQFRFMETDYWVQGLNFGAEYRW